MTLRASFLLSLNTCIASGLAISLSFGIHTSAYADTTPPSLPDVTVTANALCPAGQYHVGSHLGSCIDLGTVLGGGAVTSVTGQIDGGSGPFQGYTIMPLLPKINCAIKRYSAVQAKHAINRVGAYAYKDQTNGTYNFYSQPLASLPSSWDPVFGITQQGGTQSSYVFDRPKYWSSFPLRFYYSDPYTGVNAYFDPTFTVFETDLLVTVHEIAHQNGYIDEREANGPAALALKEYRNDQNGAHCN